MLGRLRRLGEHGVAEGLTNTSSPYGDGLSFFICEMGLRPALTEWLQGTNELGAGKWFGKLEVLMGALMWSET